MIKNLNANSEKVLVERYYLKDDQGNVKEDWETLCKRVVDTVIGQACENKDCTEPEIKKFKSKFFKLINNLYFLPNSPTLFNAGTKNQMLSACFVIDVEDSLEEIYESIKESALIHKMGGGVGLSFGKLRTKGSTISTTHGGSSGAISFMRAFSNATSVVTAGGRRHGANMGILPCWHGDIEEFISCKQRESELANFNISVAITDDFMKAAKENKNWDLYDPSKEGVLKTVNAKKLLNKIAKKAWSNGEPGVCFIDVVNSDNPTPEIGKILSSNPCQPGWATVLTPEGIKTIDSVSVGDMLWTGKCWSKIVRKEDRGKKQVYAYKTVFGNIFYGTKNHQILDRGIKTEVDEAKTIDLCKGPSINEIPTKPLLDDSNLFYDGGYFTEEDLHTKTETYTKLCKLFHYYGVFENNCIEYKAPSIDRLHTLQLVLSRFGITTYVEETSEDKVYKLVIFHDNDKKEFKRLFSDYIKKTEREVVLDAVELDQSEDLTNSITGKVPINKETVYDITVDAPEHTYWSGGLLVANCGEFYSIPYNSCNLGSINLLKFVGRNGKFNFTKFRSVIKDITFFLNCVIDVCDYPLEKIKQTTHKTRPIGIGVFNFANLLIKMNIVYGSPESFELAENLSEIISLTSLEASAKLAEKQGVYPAFKAKNHQYEKYIKSSKKRKTQWKKLVSKINKTGLRNSHTLVIAPTGTLARIANEGSFGIEPIFSFEYESNILDGQTIKYTHPFLQDFKANKLDVDKDVFVAAKDIDPYDHLKMQAAWQKYTHNGISKTINLPKTTTEEEILGIYIKAWELGLKGVTVYREGSRQQEVLVDSDGTNSKKPGRPKIDIDEKVLKALVIKEKMSLQKLSEVFNCSSATIKNRLDMLGISVKDLSEPIKRPTELYGPCVKVPTSLGSLYINIGEDTATGKPIETVLNISKSGTSVLALTEALGKITSKALQYHVDVKEIIKTLVGIGGDDVVWWEGKAIKSIPDAVAKVLMRYLDDTEKKDVPIDFKPKDLSNNSVCPNCGLELVYQEGCFICTVCAYSKCGG